MINLFYQLLVYLSEKWGLWVLYTAVRIIATGYFLFFPRRVAVAVRFYKALFPERSTWYAVRSAWKQFHNFAQLYIDRYLIESPGAIEYTAAGLEHITDAAEKKTGGILLMSHAGNWEVAARLLKNHGLPLLLFMSRKTGEQIEDIQKNTLKKNGVEIIAGRQGRSSPLEILEGVRYLRRGWVLSIAGDRSGDPGQSFVETEFLDHIVRLPETPYALAHATGVPIYVFFAFRTGPRNYHFTIHPPIFLRRGSRQSRRQQTRSAVRQYARLLEQAVRQYPFQWYHFEPFLGRRQPTGGETIDPDVS
ncbi:MAG: lauroyl acyltransferase [Desulfosudaceae bacterium]